MGVLFEQSKLDFDFCLGGVTVIECQRAVRCSAEGFFVAHIIRAAHAAEHPKRPQIEVSSFNDIELHL